MENTKELIYQYRERLEKNNLPVIFDLPHLCKILKIPFSERDKFFSKNRGNMYHLFSITKKSGGERIIEAPDEQLKVRQRWIKENILDKMHVSNSAMGFKKEKSIYDNALKHVGKELVITVDIKDFFPSICYNRVFRVFYYYGYTSQVSHLLTKLCTNGNNVLPQGAPTSPAISNVILLKLDVRMERLARKANCIYSRYADDITFSGDKSIKYILSTVYSIIESEGFSVNKQKTRLQYKNCRQEVTGLTVNSKISVSKSLELELTKAIYYCKKFGVKEHMKYINCNKSFYKEHLYGIAYFIKMIDRPKGEKYIKELDVIEWAY